MFQVGQQVVCIVEVGGAVKGYPAGTVFPRKNAVYTVRAVEYFEDFTASELVLCIWVEEIVNTVNLDLDIGPPIEPMWPAGAFRPAVRTDISELRKLLAPSPADAREPEHA